MRGKCYTMCTIIQNNDGEKFIREIKDMIQDIQSKGLYWEYIKENVIDKYSFEDCFKSDEREHIKDLIIEAFNAGMSYRKNSK